MRTDAKIGFAIVGVLVAVLVVYAVVIPRHKRAGQVAANQPGTVKLVPDASGTDHVDVPPGKADAEPPAILPVPPHGADHAGDRVTDPVTPLKPITPNDLTARGDQPAGPGPLVTPLPNVIDDTPDLTGGAGKAKAEPKHGKVAKRASHRGDDHATVAVAGGRPYTVRAGQTLSSIANDLYGDPHAWVQIRDANPRLNPSKLRVGAKIMVPDATAVRPRPAVVVPADVTIVDDSAPVEPTIGGGRTYVVRAGDSLYRIARRQLGSGREADALFAANRDVIGASPSRLRTGMVLRLPSAPLASIAR